MKSKLEVLNPNQEFFLLKNAFPIPKLQYVLRASPAYLCIDELRIFNSALFDSLGKVAKVPMEGDVCKQAGFIVCFTCLGYRRAGVIDLPSFLASMNSVGDLMETILSRNNIVDTIELGDAVESWRGASGCASFPDHPLHGNSSDPRIIRRNLDEMLREVDQVYRPRHSRIVGLASMLFRFRRLGHYLTLRPLGSTHTDVLWEFILQFIKRSYRRFLDCKLQLASRPNQLQPAVD